jgi:hypothetical protein
MGERCSEGLAGPVALADGAVPSKMLCLNQVVLLRLRFAGPLMPIGTGATIACSVLPVLAYRPFDGTDAAVADLNEVEIELTRYAPD